jgi:hypothetical protein
MMPALATRMMNAAPATRWAIERSLASDRQAAIRSTKPNRAADASATALAIAPPRRMRDEPPASLNAT